MKEINKGDVFTLPVKNVTQEMINRYADAAEDHNPLHIDPDFAISQGMVEYASSLEAAVAHSRAGANPLVVKAVAVQGGRNSANKVNVVVPAEDGNKILLANEKTGMLHHCAVVFVK